MGPVLHAEMEPHGARRLLSQPPAAAGTQVSGGQGLHRDENGTNHAPVRLEIVLYAYFTRSSILHVRQSRKLSSFFTKEGGSGVVWTWGFFVKEAYLMLDSIQSQCLYCFRRLSVWSMYFSSLLSIFQCNKRQGSCLLPVSNTHTPYSSKFYGDVQHEGITTLHLVHIRHLLIHLPLT